MPTRKVLISYLVLFAIAGTAAGLGYRLLHWGHDVLACAVNRQPGTFLAYCMSDQYGDYEHGAYFSISNRKPSATSAMPKCCFSATADAIRILHRRGRTIFRDRSIPFYLLGFGYADGVQFSLDLISKYHLAPRFLVIDVNPFFPGFLSVPARDVSADDKPEWLRPFERLPAWWDYASKKAFNALHPGICRSWPALCDAAAQAVYRESRNGFWVFGSFAQASLAGIPIKETKLVHIDKHPRAADLANARRLFAAVGLPPECLVLTSAPSNALDVEPYATEISRLLGLRLVLPHLDGLTVFDASHLSRSSAERWSAAVMQQIGPLMEPCLAASSHRSE